MGLRFARTGLPWVVIACIVAALIAIGVFGAPPIAFGISALLLVALLVAGIFRPSSSLLYPTITHGPRNCACVALTFDDGPDPDTTPRVLDLLAQYDARASFFVIGHKLEAEPALARRMIAEGHSLGNHTWRHSRWQNFYRRKSFEREVELGERAIASVTGESRPLYRPPVGIKTPGFARIAYRRDLTVIAWSLHSHDSRLHDPERIARRVLHKVRPGDIILMHDGHDLPHGSRPACADALKLILRGLKQRNLESITVSQLLDKPIHPTIPSPSGNQTTVRRPRPTRLS